MEQATVAVVDGAHRVGRVGALGAGLDRQGSPEPWVTSRARPRAAVLDDGERVEVDVGPDEEPVEPDPAARAGGSSTAASADVWPQHVPPSPVVSHRRQNSAGSPPGGSGPSRRASALLIESNGTCSHQAR